MKQKVFDQAMSIAREKSQSNEKLFTQLELEQAKAAAFEAGRVAGLGEAKERLNELVDFYQAGIDKEEALPESRKHQMMYLTHLREKTEAMREGASAIDGLKGGNDEAI